MLFNSDHVNSENANNRNFLNSRPPFNRSNYLLAIRNTFSIPESSELKSIDCISKI